MTIDEPVITHEPERHSKETIQKLLKHLRVTPWTLAIGLVTLVFLVGAVIWYQGYAHDLTTHQPIWWIFALAVVAAFGQYWGYAISLRGASTKPIPKLRTFELEVAESVTYVFTPESIGSLALTVRFLYKQGFTSAEAAGAGACEVRRHAQPLAPAADAPGSRLNGWFANRAPRPPLFGAGTARSCLAQIEITSALIRARVVLICESLMNRGEKTRVAQP